MDLQPGRVIKLNGDPYLITDNSFTKKDRQKPTMKTKLKNLRTGQVIPKTFYAADFEMIEVVTRKCQYLYKDDSSAHFMDQESFEQFEVPVNTIEEQLKFLLDGCDCHVMLYEENPISVQLPFKVDLKVVETPPGVKGDTASGGTKPATLETGIVVQVPLFINEGDIVKVNTERCEYVERTEKK